MLTPQPKPKRTKGTSSKGLMAATTLICVSVLSFYTASKNPNARPKLQPAYVLDGCRPEKVSMAKIDRRFVGSTQAQPWLYFNRSRLFALKAPREISTAFVPFGKAIVVDVAKAGTHSYDIGVSMLNQRKIERGAWVKAEVWLKATSADHSKVPIVIEGKLQENNNEFNLIKSEQLRLSSSYLPYLITAQTSRAYCPEELNFALHLATGAQTIEVGPGFLTLSKPK